MKYLSFYRDLTFPVYLLPFGTAPDYASRLTLMYPPSDDNGYLCSFPESLSEINIDYPTLNFPTIGLFVKYGNCTVQEKAEVSLKIQLVFPTVQFLLLYDASLSPNETAFVPPTTLQPDPSMADQFSALTVLLVTYDDALRVNEELEAYRDIRGTKRSPYLSDQFNGSWAFDFALSGLWRPGGNSGVNVVDKEESSPNFFWFRFVLFGLLIVAPCIRAVYLWYMGGGRIHLRRNENGRVVGLLYIPPVPFWLSIGRLQQPTTPIRDTLSEEAFDSLPEIKYTPPEMDRIDNINTQIASPVERKDPDSVDDKKKQAPSSGQEEDDALNVSFASEAEKGELGTPDDEVCSESRVASTASPLATLRQDSEANEVCTTCTTCSICIDDFIPGETLTLLPRFVSSLCSNALRVRRVLPFVVST